MKKRVLLALAVLASGLSLAWGADAALYQYKDKDGVIHFTDRPELAPERYRDQVKPVRKEITVEKKPNSVRDYFAKGGISWNQMLIFDDQGIAVGLKQKTLFWKNFKKSRLVIWASAEVALLIIAAILLISFRNWPTQKGRKNSLISIIAGYLILAPAILVIFLMPSAAKFLNLSRLDLAEIRGSAQLDQATSQKIEELDRKLGCYQDKLPW